MPTLRNVVRLLGVAALVVVWALLAHDASSQSSGSDLAVIVAVVSALSLLPLFWRILHPTRVIVGTLTLGGLLAGFWPDLRHNVALLYYLQHLAIHLVLALLFGRTLFRPGDSLVTQMARLAHEGFLSSVQLRYTRRVTIAWTAYFLLVAAVSSALFFFAPPVIWSFFANVLSVPLLFTMFAAEYIVRQFALPPAERAGIADSVRAYRTAVRDGFLFSGRR